MESWCIATELMIKLSPAQNPNPKILKLKNARRTRKSFSQSKIKSLTKLKAEGEFQKTGNLESSNPTINKIVGQRARENWSSRALLLTPADTPTYLFLILWRRRSPPLAHT